MTQTDTKSVSSNAGTQNFVFFRSLPFRAMHQYSMTCQKSPDCSKSMLLECLSYQESRAGYRERRTTVELAGNAHQPRLMAYRHSPMTDLPTAPDRLELMTEDSRLSHCKTTRSATMAGDMIES
ncbi:hypothetical protein IAQ61_003085 [Plenodomus lingam]|uniref:uncharacterized protein n=1 Tax=Leptosphaeria maculans TaxID=5022 RepID=UPI0033244D2F|nr:hypothetical protein IAQ61_003085 [Plenodomus lingam]